MPKSTLLRLSLALGLLLAAKLAYVQTFWHWNDHAELIAQHRAELGWDDLTLAGAGYATLGLLGQSAHASFRLPDDPTALYSFELERKMPFTPWQRIRVEAPR